MMKMMMMTMVVVVECQLPDSSDTFWNEYRKKLVASSCLMMIENGNHALNDWKSF